MNGGNPTYNTRIAPSSSAKPPSDTNLMEATPLFPVPVPPADLNIKFLIEFYGDDYGVNRPHVNGAIFPGFNDQSLQKPVLFEYMSHEGGELSEEPDDILPVGGWIPGNASTPFVLPYNRTIDVWFKNLMEVSIPCIYMDTHFGC